MIEIRRELLWDHDVPPDPEADEGFLAFYVGRVLERGSAADVRALGLDRIRRYLDRAPASREVIDLWHWFLARHDGHPDSGGGRGARTAAGRDAEPEVRRRA